MLKAGVGFSKHSNGTEAAREATNQAMESGGIDTANWAIIFCTFPHKEHYRDMLKSVCEITQTSNVTGCSGIGVLANLGEIEAEPGVSVLAVSTDLIEVTSFISGDSTEGGFKAGVEIGKKLNPIKGDKALLTFLPDPFNINPYNLFEGVESQLGSIPIVGATASENPNVNETTEFCGDTVSQSSVSGLMIQGDFNYIIGITQGCQPVGPPFVITKCENNIIIEIDDKPAFDVLKEYIPQSLIENPRDMMHMVFIGFSPVNDKNDFSRGNYLIRNLSGFNPESGLIGVAENVIEGQNITFAVRNSQMAREDLKQMLERMKSSSDPNKPFRFGFYFNCCARGSYLYGQKGIDTAYINHYLGNIPIVGFFGNSEFSHLHGKNHIFTYTGVLVLISE